MVVTDTCRKTMVLEASGICSAGCGMQPFLGHSRCIYSIKRSNNLSISLFASESFVEHSNCLLWYFFDLRGFLYTAVVIRMPWVCVVNVLLQ